MLQTGCFTLVCIYVRFEHEVKSADRNSRNYAGHRKLTATIHSSTKITTFFLLYVVWSGSGVVSLHGGRIGQCSQSSCDAALLSTLTIFRLNRNDHFFSCDAFLVSKFTLRSRYFDGLGDICVRSSRILETAVWTCIRIVYSGVPGM